MDTLKITDALSSMSRRDLEDLQEQIAQRLLVCVVCGSDGAYPMRVSGGGPSKGSIAALTICPACFEKYRLPEGRLKK